MTKLPEWVEGQKTFYAKVLKRPDKEGLLLIDAPSIAWGALEKIEREHQEIGAYNAMRRIEEMGR